MNPAIDESKRLFFGFQVDAPWPAHLPKGRVIEERCRHSTLAFLGQISFNKIKSLLPSFPSLPFLIAPVGFFDQPLFLPIQDPNVIAWHMHLQNLDSFYFTLVKWLNINDIPVKIREDFLPHVTIARTPFDSREWQQEFIKLPFKITGLHLYESKGNLKYHSCWHYPIQEAFVELEHTADIAYKIYGHHLQEIYYNAFIALSFEFPEMLDYYIKVNKIDHLDDIVMLLNKCISLADTEIGCPFKAVSFHGNIQQQNNYLTWEMIIDV